MASTINLIFAFFLLLFSLIGLSTGSIIGVCYGQNADDLPPPDKVVELAKQHKIKHIRIYDSNTQVLKAFSNTSIGLMIAVPNSDLLPFSQHQSYVETWLNTTVLPYYPATKITHITVGSEATEDPNNSTAFVVPAMQNVLTALKKTGLDKKIKVSTTHSLRVLSRSFPPSAGAFDSRYAYFLKPLFDFLSENDSPFMVDVYPYYAYRDSSTNVSLDYALFQSSSEVIDPNTGLLYTNMFDSQIDAIYYALMGLNYKTVKVVVTETGWPSKGSRNESAATPENAQTYNVNVIRHVINNTGTPAKPREELDVYVFSLFNENKKPGMESERNWGLFYPDGTGVYSLDLTGKGGAQMGGGSHNGRTWCIASSTASERKLKDGLNWACGAGDVDCTAIQPSQPCYEPNNVESHASYVFNSYFQMNGATDVACDFGGAGVKVTKDPSYEKCVYTTNGNKTTTAANSATLASTTTFISIPTLLIRLITSLTVVLYM